MKTILLQRLYLSILLLMTSIVSLNAQVGIGTTSPAPSSILDINDGTASRGVLLPRLDINDFTTQSPVTGSIEDWLLAFNTNASSGTGFYYWDGTAWVPVGHNKFWSVQGNKNTDPSTNFLGTADNFSLNFRTNDFERMTIDAAGTVGIGDTPFSDTALRVSNSAQPYGIISETSSNGIAVLGIDSGSGTGLSGQNTGTGLGVFGYSANNHGMYATTAYTGGAFLTGGMIGWGTGADNANGVLAVTDKIISSQSNMGLRAVSGSTTSISSSTPMNVGVNSNATDLGLYVMTEGPIRVGSSSYFDYEAARFQTNYRASPIDSDARDPRAQLAGFTWNSLVGGSSMYYGGYFYSGGSSSNSSYAYAGSRYGGTNYKIIGNGTVSTIVEGTTPGDKKVMFAPEAPEVLFEDYGTASLVAGQANITIDPIFAKNIQVDANHPLKVFIQLEGDCKGVYVTNKTANGFSVRELQSGNSNVDFSWHIVANRKDVTGGTPEENSRFSDLRFPDAPDAIGPSDQANQDVKPHNEGKIAATNSSKRN